MASWEKIKTQIGKVTNKVVAKTGEVADTASKHVKLKTIEGNLSEKYELLGRLAYKHIRGGEVSEEKVEAVTAEIAELIAQKKQIKAEIEADKERRAAEKQAKKDAKAAEEAEEAALEELEPVATEEVAEEAAEEAVAEEAQAE
jgi:hypothetical protein